MSQLVLRKSSGALRFPDRCVFIDVEPRVGMDAVRQDCQRHSFGVGWMTACWLRHGDVVDRMSTRVEHPWMFWSLLDEVRDRNKCTWVFSHNLGYDLTLLGFWDWLPRSGATLVGCVLDDPPCVITVRLGRRLIRFVDVINYWRLSLSDLAKSVGNPLASVIKGDSRHHSDPELCKCHVQVIESCMLSLISTMTKTCLCSLRQTAASQSWALYTRHFLCSPVWTHSNSRAKWLERAAYYGGRVSAFTSGTVNKTVRVLDVNSLYPHVMAKHTYPCRLLKRTTCLRPAELLRTMESYDAIAHVMVNRPAVALPNRTDTGVDYLCRSGDYVLAGEELRGALKSLAVTGVIQACLYETADLFSSFVKHFYALKLEAVEKGDRAGAMIWKLILNSLHGKFGQKGRAWMPAPHIPSRGYYAYWWHARFGAPAPVRCRSIAGVVESRTEGPEPRHAAPSIAAAITANARMLLAADITRAGGPNVLYCDTDSLHVLPDGYSRLARYGRLSETALGNYRVVCQGDSATYYGHQHYRVGDKWCLSGIKPSARQVADGVYLQDAVQGVERTLETGAAAEVIVTPRVVHRNQRSSDASRQYEPTCPAT